MTCIYSVTNTTTRTIRVILEDPHGSDWIDSIVAMGAAAAKMQVDTYDLQLRGITDCDGLGGRNPRDPGTDRPELPTSRIVDLEVTTCRPMSWTGE